ncbi:MAG: SulP family inorganic anion transporter [Bacteroidales bacterium]|jgi:SulP family sulfate permease|nr:SulP family inorganic anion transporter [Bacteroidales bacterium]
MKLQNDIFFPKIFTTLKTYTREQFTKDLIAGLIVGIVALPLAIAFGVASGLTMEQGLITAIVGGFFISFLGGSKVQIGGPTGSFIVIVAAIIAQYGTTGLYTATIMAGLILIFLGLLKLGDVIKFIPYPVVVGFTSGIAVIIFSTQISDFFGLGLHSVPAAFHEKWRVYLENFVKINPYTTIVALGSTLITFFWSKINKVIPGSLIAIILGTVIVSIFNLPVETIQDYASAKAALPAPQLPNLSFSMIQALLPYAFTIAMVVAIESLLSALVSDGVIGGNHRSNTELISTGISNLIVPLFGGLPATGVIARTMTNIKNGGRTPIAGIVHALTLLVIFLFAWQWAQLIPMSCLAGILVVVSYQMSEWRSFKNIIKRNSKSEAAVLIATCLLTVLFDLTIAIEVGLLLALFLFVRRVSRTTEISVIKDSIQAEDGEAEWHSKEDLIIPESVDVFEINGPFFFGIANKFEEVARDVEKKPKVRIIRMRRVPFMDSTGLRNLRNFVSTSRADKITVILSGINDKVMEAIKADGLFDYIGAENIHGEISSAVRRAGEIANQ